MRVYAVIIDWELTRIYKSKQDAIKIVESFCVKRGTWDQDEYINEKEIETENWNELIQYKVKSCEIL